MVSGSRNHTQRPTIFGEWDLGGSEINRGETFFFSGGEITPISPCYGAKTNNPLQRLLLVRE